MKNFQVRCINDDGRRHTKGKVYEVINGKLSDDGKGIWGDGTFESIAAINTFMLSKFELVEEKEISCTPYIVKCTHSGGWHTIGKIYKVINGKIEIDNGTDTYGYNIDRYPNVEVLNSKLLAQFELYDLTLSDLQNTMVIETRSGNFFMWFNGAGYNEDGRITEFNEDLTHKAIGDEIYGSGIHDIVGVYVLREGLLTGYPLENNKDNLIQIWERAAAKEMTLEELLDWASLYFGQDVILKGDDYE